MAKLVSFTVVDLAGAGKYEANLSDAYKFVSSLVLLAEYFLEHTKQATSSQECIPTDMFGSAELDTNML